MKYNNYSLSILFTTLAGIGFSIAMLLLNGFGAIELPPSLIELIYGANFVFTLSQLVAGVGYINRGVDTLTNENTLLELGNSKPEPLKVLAGLLNRINGQFIGLVIGLCLAITISIVMGALQVALPGSNVLGSSFSGFICFIGYVASYAGFGNRVGRIFDYINGQANSENRPFFRRPNVNYILGVTGGIVVGLTLAVVTLSVIGVTSAMTFGGALPLWLGAGLFTLATLGGCASAGGYIGRVFDNSLGERTAAGALFDLLAKPFHVGNKKSKAESAFTKEAALTFAGLAIGLMIGIILISAGALSIPMFGLGLPKLIAGIILMATCISAFSGLGNRVGHMIDKFSTQDPEPDLSADMQDSPNTMIAGLDEPALIIPSLPSPDPTSKQAPQNNQPIDKLNFFSSSPKLDPQTRTSNEPPQPFG